MPSRSIPFSVALCALLAGCRLPCWGDPVSGDVLNCRQHTQRGLAAIDRGQWDEAEASLNQAVRACPIDGEARRHYAEALWRRGARQEAVAQLQEAVRLSSDDPQLIVRLGETLVAEGRWREAVACAHQALDLDPKFAPAWVLRAQAIHRGGQPRQALADYHRAISCQPGNRDALLQIAEVHRQLGQPDRALLALQCLADTYPLGEEPQQVSFLTGLAYAALGRQDDAIESYSRAARNNPTPEILAQLADCQLQAGQFDQSRQTVEHALALDPRHEPSRVIQEKLAAAAQSNRLQR